MLWLRDQPERQDLVQACYYDDPLLGACQRFARGEEWRSTRYYLSDVGDRALDLGAGRGISSFALARDGFRVTALEPDPSPTVGAGAIRALISGTDLPIDVIEAYAEEIPLPGDTFDVVYARQTLHHARDLAQMAREAYRVLRVGGTFVATREHVIDRPEDLEVFRVQHPLHHLYGGENAFTLRAYLQALRSAGFRVTEVLGPYSSVINYAPTAQREHEARLRLHSERLVGHRIVGQAWKSEILRPFLISASSSFLNWCSSTPGRLYSFMAVKDIGA